MILNKIVRRPPQEVKSEMKKQVISTKELIGFFEQLKARTEEHLRVVRDAELDHVKETLEKLKELLS